MNVAFGGSLHPEIRDLPGRMNHRMPRLENGEIHPDPTVVFADLSGFTELSERMDPEDVRSMVDDCMRQMGELVERFGGSVDKVIGDALMAVFGAYVGGHLTFGIGTAVNHNAFFEGPMDYVKVGTREDFPEGEMRRVEAQGLPVVILRRDGLLRAIGAVCAQPAERGRVRGDVGFGGSGVESHDWSFLWLG